jgi:hypothetical protein
LAGHHTQQQQHPMLVQQHSSLSAPATPACRRHASSSITGFTQLRQVRHVSSSNRRPCRRSAGPNVQASLLDGLFGRLQAPASSSSKFSERPAYNKRETVQLGSLEVGVLHTQQTFVTLML